MSRDGKLAEYQAANRHKTICAVEQAKQQIEAELKEHGFYPHNRGRITRREVFKRAGIGKSTLKNPTHTVTAEALDRWLTRVKKQAPTLKPAADATKLAQINEARQQLDQIAQHYNLFVLEHNDLLRRYEALEAGHNDLLRHYEALKAENACLERRLAEDLAARRKVTSIGRKR